MGMKKKAWAIVIPFSSKAKATYAAKCLKDYVVMDKFIKEVELDSDDEKAEYSYLEKVI